MARDERDPRDLDEPRDHRDSRRLTDPTDPRDERVVPVDPRDERAPGDVRDQRLPFDVADGAARPVPLIGVAAFEFLLALDMIFSPLRFSNTPSYRNLINLLPAPTWGAAYILAALLLALAIGLPKIRALAVVAVTYNGVLLAVWLVAFVIRRVTDTGTTVANVGTWGLLLLLVIYSATRLVVRR